MILLAIVARRFTESGAASVGRDANLEHVDRICRWGQLGLQPKRTKANRPAAVRRSTLRDPKQTGETPVDEHANSFFSATDSVGSASERSQNRLWPGGIPVRANRPETRIAAESR